MSDNSHSTPYTHLIDWEDDEQKGISGHAASGAVGELDWDNPGLLGGLPLEGPQCQKTQGQSLKRRLVPGSAVDGRIALV
jgi:hypothetical protein